MTRPLLATLLPDAVAAVEAFGDPPEVQLFPEEAAAVAGAVHKRKREFTGARACARAALARIGQPAAPLVPGLHGAPGWTGDVVGSMTHCENYCAAAVARSRDVIGLGVDAEPAGALPAGVLEAVALPGEVSDVMRWSASAPDVPWDRLLFSAKESVYKTVFPVTRMRLDFHEARLCFHRGTGTRAGTFTARILRAVPPAHTGTLSELQGRWVAGDGLVVTAIAVLRPVMNGAAL